MTSAFTRQFIDKHEYYVVQTPDKELFFRKFTDMLKFLNMPTPETVDDIYT